MAFFWRNKPKSDLVKPTKDLLTRLRQPPKLQKASKCVLMNNTITDTVPDGGRGGQATGPDEARIDRDSRFVDFCQAG